MKTINDLVEFYDGKRLWFYIPKKSRKNFYKEVKKMGVKFSSGKKILPFRITEMMAISNGQLSYISCASWIRSKLDKNVIKIDYKKFIDKENYVIKD